MSEMMLSLLTLSPLSLLSFSFAPCGSFKCENDSGVNQNRYLLQLIGEFRLNAAIGRVAPVQLSLYANLLSANKGCGRLEYSGC